jgi:hypothetical protein
MVHVVANCANCLTACSGRFVPLDRKAALQCVFTKDTELLPRSLIAEFDRSPKPIMSAAVSLLKQLALLAHGFPLIPNEVLVKSTAHDNFQIGCWPFAEADAAVFGV